MTTLVAGTKLGRYEIVALIGAGGMGEVYRARDTKLGRDVALKVLPEAFAQDTQRMQRFQREAQVLASLNHPGIAAIYGFEEAGAAQSTSEGAASSAPTVHALVMELVEGPTLADRIAQGTLPVEEEALPIAKQIAEALEYAHEHGIIHRDLKPANIKFTPNGQVKVLDFGLAKALGEETPAGDISNSPTLSLEATRAGMILGTAAYMSPEQARGKPVDRRADIWSFGVVLFEMLTGRQIFGGETASDSMAAVITREPDWEALPAGVPPHVRKLLRRCLAKDPKQRLQAIGEARISIDDCLSGSAATSLEARSSSAIVPTRRRWGFFFAGAVLLTAIAVALGIWNFLPRPQQLPTRRFQLLITNLRVSLNRSFAISPDGSKVAYVVGSELWLWDLSQLQPRELSAAGEFGTGEPNGVPFWSPDSQSLAYALNKKLWRLSLQDGVPTTICNIPDSFSGAVWSPDGNIIFSTARGPMYAVSALGGDPRVLIPLDTHGEDVDFHEPGLLPGGKGVVYAVHRELGTDTLEVFSGGKRKVVFRVNEKGVKFPQILNDPQYSPPGYLIYRRDQGNVGLWAVPFSLSSLQTTGEPFLIAAGGKTPSVASDGTLIYFLDRTGTVPAQLAWVRDDGTVEKLLGEPKLNLHSPALSPDGRRIAYVATEDGEQDIWVLNAVTGTDVRLTFTPEDESSPAWIPGQEQIAFTCVVDKDSGVCAKAADGSGQTRTLAVKAGNPVFSPDGRYMAAETFGRRERAIVILDLNAGKEPQTILSGNVDRHPTGFTADGKFLSYWSAESGETEMYLVPFPAGEGKWEIPQADGPGGWAPDHKHYLLGREVEGRMSFVSVPVETAPSVSFGKPRILFAFDSSKAWLQSGFDAASDGKHYVFVQNKTPASSTPGIIVVQNWSAEFRDKQKR